MLDVRQRRAPRRYIRRHAAVGKLILACLRWGFSTALTKIVLDQLIPVDLSASRSSSVRSRLISWRSLAVLVPAARTPDAAGFRSSGTRLDVRALRPGVRRTTASHAALLLVLDNPAHAC